MRGTQILLLASQEIPSCNDCQTWLYNDDWEPVTRGDKPQRRPLNVITPCHKCPKSEDKKTPNPDAELTDRSYRALQFYYQIRAGMPMPADELVAWYSGLLCWTLDRIQQHQSNVAPLLGAMLGGTTTKAKR